MIKIECFGGELIDADIELLDQEECTYFQELADTGELRFMSERSL